MNICARSQYTIGETRKVTVENGGLVFNTYSSQNCTGNGKRDVNNPLNFGCFPDPNPLGLGPESFVQTYRKFYSVNVDLTARPPVTSTSTPSSTSRPSASSAHGSFASALSLIASVSFMALYL
jgi:hypothetical protein